MNPVPLEPELPLVPDDPELPEVPLDPELPLVPELPEVPFLVYDIATVPPAVLTPLDTTFVKSNLYLLGAVKVEIEVTVPIKKSSGIATSYS